MHAEFRGEKEYLSNFYPCEIEALGKTWPSSEHLFQSFKTNDEDIKEQIRNCPFKGKKGVKAFAHSIKIRPDWDWIKVYIMFRVVKTKFDQHPELKEKLIASGKEPLVEHNYWKDDFFGVHNHNPKGTNVLGGILMSLRSLYQEEEK